MTLHYSAALWVLVDALCVYRLTRLVGKDLLLDKFRLWVAARSLGWFDFLVCPWCLSIWIAAGVVFLTCFGWRWWVYIATALAFSAVAGFLGERDG